MSLLAALLIGQNASQWRAKADFMLTARRYSEASVAFSRAAELYDELGDRNAAKNLRERAARWRTELGLFAPVTPPQAKLALHEPRAGCYLGANVEREDGARDPADFDRAIARNHAMFFMYRAYGKPFPREYAERCRRLGAALQIAFEPRSYAQVKDDAYLYRFAADAGKAGLPIFLRFAGEMNGAWTPYHRDAFAYQAMFRRVATRMHATASNVAMVWCPNEIPEGLIRPYYPGRDAVDWVGVNFYAVPFQDADRSRSGEFRMPTDALDYVYRSYSGTHPIMVGEWAASHRSVVDNRERPEFAIRKIREFYGRLPLLYPRVKAVSWLSFDATKYATGDRRLNDYSLLARPEVARAYRDAVAGPHYLSTVGTSARVGWRSTPTAGRGDLQVAVRTYDAAAKVVVRRGGRVIATGVPASPIELPPGGGGIEVTITDSRGRVAGRKVWPG